jgi:hypothetical protein
MAASGNHAENPLGGKSSSSSFPKQGRTKQEQAMATKSVDLAKLFSFASKVLAQNQDTLNQSDTYNHNHGDNMVEVFQVITQAMKEKKGASSADQLEYAAQLLRQQTQSGSGQAYASGLERAAEAFTGKSVTKQNVGTLIQSLFGAQQVSPQSVGGGDLLGNLLSGLAGGGQQQGGSQNIDAGDLLNAGLSYLSAKQAGKGDLEALMGAVVGNSTIGQGGRAESGALIANALMAALSKMK